MRPTYQVRVWQEDDWWLARVVSGSEGSDSAPLNAITQARSLARIESMSRDLIATILDDDEDAVDVELEYILPDHAGDLVSEAKGARAWLDAAQDLWQRRSAAAARALADMGYSLRETATLLGLSHQRVDQLLGGGADQEQNGILVIHYQGNADIETRQLTGAATSHDVDALLVVHRNLAAQGGWPARGSDIDAQINDRMKEFVRDVRSQVSEDGKAAEPQGAGVE
jgi:hypothetical protein